MKYICIKEFFVPKYDGDGFDSGEYMTIEKGSMWLSDDTVDYIGGEIHLDNLGNGDWIEISFDTLHEYFQLID